MKRRLAMLAAVAALFAAPTAAQANQHQCRLAHPMDRYDVRDETTILHTLRFRLRTAPTSTGYPQHGPDSLHHVLVGLRSEIARVRGILCGRRSG